MQNIKNENTSSEKRLLCALQGEVTPTVPFWLMRQAGRYLLEYRELRAEAGSFLDLCYTPEFAIEVTLQPIRRFDMDAAILFSDILVIPHALGQHLAFIEGQGPRLDALTARDDFKKLSFDNFDQTLAPVYETIKGVCAALSEDKALIGFAGAPWTVACYMIQGKGDGEFLTARHFAMAQPDLFDGLMERLVEATTQYLSRQIESGVDVVQLFDSWAGVLPPPLFEKYVIQPTQKIVARLHEKYPGFPVIGFPRGSGFLYADYAKKTGIQALGLDTQVPVEKLIRDINSDMCLQGNLDPAFLLAGGHALEREVERILHIMKGRPFIFNLGHGVNKNTPPEHVAKLAELIRAYKR